MMNDQKKYCVGCKQHIHNAHFKVRDSKLWQFWTCGDMYVYCDECRDKPTSYQLMDELIELMISDAEKKGSDPISPYQSGVIDGLKLAKESLPHNQKSD